MLSTIQILSLKQGKLYGDRIPLDALPQGFTIPRRLAGLFTLIGMAQANEKGPAEAGPEVAEPQ
ncbi:hypothetical protein [Rhizobium sp. M1]|uniref:hypothetical protein n=1 Tax=Rhizobium sp. M1 TaxID=2035453 RepID=UPI000BE82947|nr:hypothetical protein [Rhizobium sp. M1]PDT10081.1 hypothetical protein CO655_13895 [Rhizobium sp. M1]